MKLIKKTLTTITLLYAFTTSAFADLEETRSYVENFTEEVFKIVQEKKAVDEIRNELIAYIKQNIDIKWTSRFVLGKNWKVATPNEKKQFTTLFEEYLIFNYAPKFEGYNGEKYKILETNALAPGKYISKILLTLSNDTEILVELYILEKQQGHKIVDIAGEGISFASTQRAEFSSLINLHGFPKFITLLEEKINNLKNPPLQKASAE